MTQSILFTQQFYFLRITDLEFNQRNRSLAKQCHTEHRSSHMWTWQRTNSSSYLSSSTPCVSFSQPGCLACVQLMPVWRLLCQQSMGKVKQQLGTPTSTPILSASPVTFSPPILRFSQTSRVKRNDLIFYSRLAWCLRLCDLDLLLPSSNSPAAEPSSVGRNAGYGVVN